MAGRQASFFTTLFFISFVFREIASQQCHGVNSIYQMMLKGHISVRRSRLRQVRRNAEIYVSLMKDVKVLMSSCSLQYVS